MDLQDLNPFWERKELVVCKEVIEKTGTFFPVVLQPKELLNHVYVSGKSGSGKSTLIQNLALNEINIGGGVCFIDPHGDSAEFLLDRIPRNRLDDVIYFNPADEDFPAAFNILSGDALKPHQVASSVTESFKAIYRSSWGPRMEELLYNSTAALAEFGVVTGGASLLCISKMLSDASYREQVVGCVADPIIRRYWLEKFPRRLLDFKSAFTSPVENKVDRLLAIPTIRRILGQYKSKIRPRYMMDNRKILICNLSTGRIEADAANFLGSLLVNSFSLAAKRRADLPEGERTPFSLYIDEFHSMTTDSLSTILSEARKYGLGLILANQYLDQMDFDIKKAIFGNVATHIVFRLGGSDADHYEREFNGAVTAGQFTDLSKFEVFIKREVASLARGGEDSDGNPAPFRALTLPPLRISKSSGDNGASIIALSRSKTTGKRDDIDANIKRFFA